MSQLSPQAKPIRVLHVVGGMNRGGIETWLMHILRSIDRDRIQMDFLVHTQNSCAYDQEIRDLGSKIIPCLNPEKPRLYSANLKAILQEYGPYHVVHSHVHFFSGFVLRIAYQVGVPTRIAHSHNDTSSVEANARWTRKIYLALMRRWLFYYATFGLAASRLAAIDLFGKQWENKLRWKLLYYGVDLKPFEECIDLQNIRAELGIPQNALVIGHIGRFVHQKNHAFLIEIAQEMIHKEPNAYFLLIGEGELRQDIEAKVAECGLKNHVCFTGSRADVPKLMRGAMDIFVFPSFYEGLGLVLVEAQAAGLPCITSTVVPEEADIIKPHIKRLALSSSAETWATEILKMQKLQLSINPKDANKLVSNSIFNIKSGITSLTKIYENSIKAQ
jgi:glycosyltransferase involved in cell wall biosynthesis